MTLLESLHSIGHQFIRIGIGGYPEGHPYISPEVLDRALERKAQHVNYVIAQLCFNTETTQRWARQLCQRGIELPIIVGLPGAVSRQKLICISATLGLGPSARFLQKQSSMFWRFFLPGGCLPDRLIERLAPPLRQPGSRLHSFHFFTFNEIEKTEAWRQARLRQLR